MLFLLLFTFQIHVGIPRLFSTLGLFVYHCVPAYLLNAEIFFYVFVFIVYTSLFSPSCFLRHSMIFLLSIWFSNQEGNIIPTTEQGISTKGFKQWGGCCYLDFDGQKRNTNILGFPKDLTFGWNPFFLSFFSFFVCDRCDP